MSKKNPGPNKCGDAKKKGGGKSPGAKSIGESGDNTEPNMPWEKWEF